MRGQISNSTNTESTPSAAVVSATESRAKNAIKKRMVKVVVLEGTFPELPTPKMYQTGRGEGGSLKVAAANAIRALLKSPALRSRHITAVKMTMSVGVRTVENENTDNASRN